MAHIPTGLVPHSKKICSFYKRVLRHIETIYYHLDEVRYQSVVMRARFDANKNIKDLRVAKKLLQEGEEQLFKEEHWQYMKFPESPGGSAYMRNPPIPDYVLDLWDPMEKACYPKYFATREKRKIEYEKFYKEQYGEPPIGHH